MWVIFGFMYPGLGSGRSAEARSLDSEGLMGGFTSSDFSWFLRKIADTSDIIASMHDEL